MPTPSKVPEGKGKKVEVKTKVGTYSAVRLSMVVMTALAMVSTSVILAALLIRLVPVKDSGSSGAAGAKVSRSADGYVTGELLVKFAANSTQLSRTQAVQKALQKPVNVSTLTTVKKRQGLKTVTQTVETIAQRVASLQSLNPVVSSAIQLASTSNAIRAKRGVTADVAGTSNALRQWYVLRITPATADLNQIATALRQQTGVEKVETDRRVNVAATRSLSSTSAGAAVKLAEAQKAASVLPGDLNRDGIVDGKDLRLLSNYLTSTGIQPTSLAGADVNRDGAIDIADLSALVDMLATLFRVPASDLTGDGIVNADDINFLTKYVVSKGPAPSPLSKADYNADGVVDLSDLARLIGMVYNSSGYEALNYGKGDANADGVVDNRDLDYLIAYLSGKGPAPVPLGLADMDLNGKVDLTDLSYLMSILFADTDDVTAAVIIISDSTTTSVAPVSADGVSVQPVVLPTYLLGDSNADGRVSTADVAYLAAYIYQKGSMPNPLGRADLNFDGVLDLSDFSRMVKLVFDQLKARVALADLNGDGVVNNADLTYLSNYLTGKGPAPDLTKADVDANGRVDLTDLSIMGEFVYQTSTPPVCADVRTVGVTTFLNGDVNANGSVTTADLNALGSIIYANAAMPTLQERADVNCDKVVTPTDVLALDARLNNTAVLTLPGDANSDGAVNASDIAVSEDTPTDVNGDGSADIRDTYTLVKLLKLNRVMNALPDLDADGKIDWSDARILVNGVFTSGAAALSSTADVNGDGTIDAADAFSFVSALGAKQSTTSVLAGDANADNLVDCRDVQYLHGVYFKKTPAPNPATRGDVNGDGVANLADAILLAQRACPATGGGVRSGDILVAVLDSGAQVKDADVRAVLAPSKETAMNAKDDDKNGYIDDVGGYTALPGRQTTQDCHGHGSAISTVVAGKTGIASFARILPVQVVDCKGSGTALTVAQGLVYATVRGADLSLVPLSGVGSSALLADVVKYAKAQGMLVISSAGNDATAMSRVFPGSIAGVLSVGATVANGKSLAAYSNTGARVYAPGSASGVKFEGTSISSAYVTGAAALALGKTPTLTVQQLEAKLAPIVVNPKNGNVLDALKAVQ
ncbi:MAG: dockerin type I domain-containing protein [bacterium]|nr:dockerin type I domain-containing protein [bacterium]